MAFLRALLLISFVLSGSLTNGQSSRSDTIKILCQNWKIKQLDQVPIDNELKEDWEYMINYERRELRSDMTFIIRNAESGKIEDSGSWSLDKTGKELTFRFKNGEESAKWIILSLSSSLFHFKEPAPENEVSLTGTLIPVKN